ncbi:MAG TPA: diguanylate cyclase, partial [Gemmataceae bacterium]|nr:diguanylate cyclase [Gemmataceae bacterium]
GEEFVVLAVGMDRARAALIAERLRAAAEANVIELAHGTLRVTLSVGAAVRTPRMAGPAALLKAADEAVYAAKYAGRNRVCLAPEPQEGEDGPARPQVAPEGGRDRFAKR